MNPWISIWLKPRQTVRQILDADPKKGVLFLAIAGGMADVLMQGLGPFLEMKVPFVVAAGVCLALGGLLGFVGLYFLGWLYRWVGRWLGGQAGNVEVRAALAWTQVPALWFFGLWAALVLVTGGDLLKFQGKEAPPAGEVTLLAAILAVVLGAAAVVVGLWRFVLTCKAVAEAHRFSGWKGFGTVAIPMALVAIPILIAITIPNVMRAREDARAKAAIHEPSPAALAPMSKETE